MNYVSSRERLNALPPLFRGADLTLRFQWTSKTASQSLYQWKRKNLVAPLGGRTDVYANMQKSPQPNWEKALLMAMPSAMIVGIESLRRAGWTTQIPSRPTVAIASTGPRYKIDRFDLSPRSRSWFERVQPGVIPHGSTALPVLSPVWSLADMLHRADGDWRRTGLAPDDIEWDEIGSILEGTWDAVIAALGAFSLPPLSQLKDA